MASLTTQLLSLSIIALQRQMAHNNAAGRNTWNSNYDYIVVGAGSAGAIVAGRLSENPTTSVLLLEAGGPATVISDMPAEAWNGMVGENDWGYQTVPQRNAGKGAPALDRLICWLHHVFPQQGGPLRTIRWSTHEVR